MATNGQFYWPSVGSSVAAYGQFGMAANSNFPVRVSSDEQSLPIGVRRPGSRPALLWRVLDAAVDVRCRKKIRTQVPGEF